MWHPPLILMHFIWWIIYSFFIKCDMARNENSTTAQREASEAFMIITVPEKNAAISLKLKFMTNGLQDVDIA